MNPPNETDELFLSWQGQVTGPHSLREVRNLLKLGKIHSLYKVQTEGQWVLLRDHLGTLDQQSRAAAARQQRTLAEPILRPPDALKPIIVTDEDEYPSHEPEGDHQDQSDASPGTGDVPLGLAITAFVLSLFFFVPFLNGITWLLALIFGHLALAGTSGRPRGRAGTLAWVALWISYVEIGYFLAGLAWTAVTEALPISIVFFILHGQMLGNAVGALIGAGILMLAVKLSAGQLIGFTNAYIGALLPSALSALGMFFLQASIGFESLMQGRNLILFGLINLILFVGQIFFWARFILLEDGSELGLTRATMASMLYTFVFLFVGIGYAVLFAVLIS